MRVVGVASWRIDTGGLPEPFEGDEITRVPSATR